MGVSIHILIEMHNTSLLTKILAVRNDTSIYLHSPMQTNVLHVIVHF